MKTKLTLFVAVLVAFSVNLAHSQTKPKEEILPSGLYEILWDGTIDDRLDYDHRKRSLGDDRVQLLNLKVMNNKISGKGIGPRWRNRNIVFTGEIISGSGRSIVLLKGLENDGKKHVYVFRGTIGKPPLLGVWYTTGGLGGGDMILRQVVKDRNLKKPKGE